MAFATTPIVHSFDFTNAEPIVTKKKHILVVGEYVIWIVEEEFGIRACQGGWLKDVVRHGKNSRFKNK